MNRRHYNKKKAIFSDTNIVTRALSRFTRWYSFTRRRDKRLILLTNIDGINSINNIILIF